MIYKGYKFYMHRKRYVKERWVCTFYSRKCRAVLTVIDKKIVSEKYCHNHQTMKHFALMFTKNINVTFCEFLFLISNNYLIRNQQISNFPEKSTNQSLEHDGYLYNGFCILGFPMYVKNKIGGYSMIYKGYKFYLYKKIGFKERWVCTFYGRKCRAVVIVIDNHIVSEKHCHNHNHSLKKL